VGITGLEYVVNIPSKDDKYINTSSQNQVDKPNQYDDNGLVSDLAIQITFMIQPQTLNVVGI